MHGRGELTDQLRHDVRGTGVVDLTRSRRYMPTRSLISGKERISSTEWFRQ
jgi:hypothetical protein